MRASRAGPGRRRSGGASVSALLTHVRLGRHSGPGWPLPSPPLHPGGPPNPPTLMRTDYPLGAAPSVGGAHLRASLRVWSGSRTTRSEPLTDPRSRTVGRQFACPPFSGTAVGFPYRGRLLIHSLISRRAPLSASPNPAAVHGHRAPETATSSPPGGLGGISRSWPFCTRRIRATCRDPWHGGPSFFLQPCADEKAPRALQRSGATVLRDREAARWHRHSKSTPTA